MKKIGIIITAVLVVLCGGLGFTGYQMFDVAKEMVDAGITRRQYDAQKVGAPEEKVRAALPKALTEAPDDNLYAGDPTQKDMPAGATCVYYTLALGEPTGPDLFRLCFVKGALAQKITLDLP